MRKHSDEDPDWQSQRMKIIGLGESSIRKSYYPELQQYIRQLEEKNRELETAYAEQTAVSEELRQQMDETTQKEQELRRSEERFRNLIDASPVPIVLVRQGRFVYANQAFCRLTGDESAADVVGRDLLDFVAPECQEMVARYSRARDTGEPAALHYESVGIRRDGSRFPYEVTVAVIELSDGPVTMAFITDISERRAAAEALAKSDARLKRAELIAGTGHWEFHLDAGYAQASDGARSIYGISGDRWRIQDVQKVPLPDYRQTLDEALRALIAGERPYDVEFRIRRPPDNAILDIHSVAEYDPRARVVFGVIQDITERKKAEANLRESEKKYRDLVETSPDGIWEVDTAGRFMYLSPKNAEMLGYDAEALHGKTFFDVLNPESVAAAAKIFQEAVRNYSGLVTVEVVAKHADGHPIDLEIRAAGATDDQGRLRGFRGISRDITDRKKAEAALRESESFLTSIVENLPMMLFVKDAKDLRFVRFNQAGEDLLGYSRKEMIGKNDYDFFPQEQADFFNEKDRLVLGGKIPVDIPEEKIGTRTRGERILHTKKIPILSENGEPRYLLGISEDITEQRKAQADLRDSEELFHSLVRESSDGITLVDEDGIVIEWNDAMARISGIPRKDAIGALNTDLMVSLMIPENRTAERIAMFRSEFKKAQETGTSPYFSEPVETSIMRQDGERRILHQLAFPIRTARGWRIGTMVRDITDVQRSAVSLEQARKKMTLLNIVTFQDIQSAVFSLTAYHILIKQLHPEAKISSFLDKESVLIQKITSSLDFAKNYQDMGMQPPRWQNVSQTFLFAISHLDFLAVAHSIETGELEIFADPLLEKVFFNLMANVLRHGSGTTSVRLWYEEKGDGSLVLSVEDNGPGIPQEEKHMIFDRGYGRDTGLGLFLVREILSITGLAIRETGTPGRGARFEILVPRAAYRFGPPS